jgi:aromatic ring-opening dioxygenase LigB subunit
MSVFACIAPHGDLDLDPSLRGAMEELGQRFAAAAPDVAVVVTPHSVHVDGHFAIVMVLQGAAGESARADVLAYAAPTYYGMLVADVRSI